MNDILNLLEQEQPFQSPERYVSDFFRILDQNDILFCSWKSNPHAEKALKGLTDIDLLVERSHADRLERLMVGQGFKRLVWPGGAGYPGIEDWLGCDDRSAKLTISICTIRFSLACRASRSSEFPGRILFSRLGFGTRNTAIFG